MELQTLSFVTCLSQYLVWQGTGPFQPSYMLLALIGADFDAL